MTSGRILFVMPDVRTPTGGVRRAYRFVDLLNAAGVHAAIVHADRDFRCDWFANDTRVLVASQLRLGGTDLVVVPEIWMPRIPEAAPGVAKVILGQNANLTLRAPADAQTSRSDHA